MARFCAESAVEPQSIVRPYVVGGAEQINLVLVGRLHGWLVGFDL